MTTTEVTEMTETEEQAVRVDASRRLEELRAVEAVLRPDIDDPEVLSEWTSIMSQIRAATGVLEGEVV